MPHLTFPRLDNPQYTWFVKQIFTISAQSKRALAAVDKKEIDAEYERQLRCTYGHDESKLTQDLYAMKSKASSDMLQHYQNKYSAALPEQTRVPLAYGVEELRLPVLPTNKTEKLNPGVDFTKEYMDEAFRRAIAATVACLRHALKPSKGTKKIDWALQTYEEFAKKTEKMNKDVSFTKEQMDEAFCLGPESEKYWRDRE
ncbi:hypothetical protein TI39_contig309g00012 [Zymoseptoria brevis]|uniref:Uncharacterized protein n=1 Tax=Zymoseptoria brevis TaxID=1047168 RepID=A0A0F4GTY1_9PEZI|nr:hypothetical protein TI39_contig309g00012 [Zymoseptoria brevis]